ncbi:uncharacterized protein CYBJADRAFT_136505 [Cyberlindnera jadinii NRRL Y-1542]|uniref:C2H2-type domain-containing protein n=1 Tax=Cyberlindnera jadinii (strain ATCC 18201 / CBS 1600 / BCRC 20928 / JCM 3617 / NBRC 0987 / NRRL Y-1542) TaxID=983966 RepID=A0A1E4S5A9_CYBJN|nr:hypothetical protein CYBJADRAFT_136505 [Cyberlindnera jadinii NRRL Y-1542]ODV74694.1 hypothetical protein CYBJADRAFT_136505 [Cyberlindnera jadinii NRRL Y-1542]
MNSSTYNFNNNKTNTVSQSETSPAYDPAKQFVCSYCMRRFKRQEHLKRHVRSLHTNEKPFDCTLCGKKFSRSDNLAQHIKTHNQMNADGQSADEQNDESP